MTESAIVLLNIIYIIGTLPAFIVVYKRSAVFVADDVDDLSHKKTVLVFVQAENTILSRQAMLDTKTTTVFRLELYSLL